MTGIAIILLWGILHLLFPFRFGLNYSTTITGADGKVIHAFLNSGDKWRMQTEEEEISPLLKSTLLHKEDRYFYYHPGVNPVALIRSAVLNLFKGKRVSGASTITMQVARLLSPRKRTYGAKLIEMFRATQLEWRYTKDEIFRMYINLLPYGSNIEGVKSASVLYFGKNPYQLSLAEIALLAIIPNKPSAFEPGRNQQFLIAARNKWLKKWQDEGLFTAKQVAEASSEPLEAKRLEAPREAPHFSHRLRQLTRSGNIHTHLRMNTQWKLEKIIENYVSQIRHMDIHNAACVVIENRSGKIIAYIGSADFLNTFDGGQVNGANAVRQPGSALKPLLYGLGFDLGNFTPQTVVSDVPLNIKGYRPENYDQTFKGPVTIAYALENSLNIPAVQALQHMGKDKLISNLIACGFRQIEKDRKKLGLSMILGGCGVTLEEMTALYTLFAGGGVYRKPSYYHNQPRPAEKRILSKASTYMVTETLAKIARPDLPVGFENSTRLPKIAWKTGTSYGRRDAWSIGYNDRFTVGVWVGNFSNKGVADLSGSAIATPLLFQIFNTLDYNSQNNWFAMPENCLVRMVCSESGFLPGPMCRQQRLDYYIPLTSPSTVCEHMKEYTVSADGAFVYCKNCQPEQGYKRKWYPVIKPEIQSWYVENQISFESLPPHNPDCEKVAKEGAPRITFPLNGSEYLISSLEPEPLQLTCEVSSGVETVYWYIDDRFYTKCRSSDKVFFNPGSGLVKISCTDDKGRNTNSWVKVRYVAY